MRRIITAREQQELLSPWGIRLGAYYIDDGPYYNAAWDDEMDDDDEDEAELIRVPPKFRHPPQSRREASESQMHLRLPTEAVYHYRRFDPTSEVPYATDETNDWSGGEGPGDEGWGEKELYQSLARKGVEDPVTIMTDGESAHLEDGNHRVGLANYLGLKDMPVQVQYHPVPHPDAVPLEPHLKKWLTPDKLTRREAAARGDCYQAAGRYMLDNDDDDLRLVHAEVAGEGPLQGKIFGHAWIEQGDTVIDNSNGRHFRIPKDAYYRQGKIHQINNFHVYDRRQALEKIIQHKHWGPWDMTGETREFDASRHVAGPREQERYKWMMDRRWDEQSHSPSELRKRHVKDIKGRPDLQEEWASRPKDSEFSGKERLPQKSLPGMEKIRGTDGRLLRGVPIDTTDPQFRRVWQMTHGQGQPVDDPGLFPDADLRYQDRGGRFDHPGLADAIVDGLNNGGAGEHWSTDYDVADDYGWGRGAGSRGGRDWRNSEQLPVLMDADWNGRGEDYGRAGAGNFDEEKEVMLNKGAPLKLRDLKVPYSADTVGDNAFDEWNPILDESRDITARLRKAEKHPPWIADALRKLIEEEYRPKHTGWYHASPHDLPEGTHLTPGGAAAASKDFYDTGYGEDRGTLQDMGGGRAEHVWLSPDEEDAGFWAMANNAPHIYEVEPHDEPRPWNGTGTDGWVTSGATIKRRVR